MCISITVAVPNGLRAHRSVQSPGCCSGSPEPVTLITQVQVNIFIQVWTRQAHPDLWHGASGHGGGPGRRRSPAVTVSVSVADRNASGLGITLAGTAGRARLPPRNSPMPCARADAHAALPRLAPAQGSHLVPQRGHLAVAGPHLREPQAAARRPVSGAGGITYALLPPIARSVPLCLCALARRRRRRLAPRAPSAAIHPPTRATRHPLRLEHPPTLPRPPSFAHSQVRHRGPGGGGLRRRGLPAARPHLCAQLRRRPRARPPARVPEHAVVQPPDKARAVAARARGRGGGEQGRRPRARREARPPRRRRGGRRGRRAAGRRGGRRRRGRKLGRQRRREPRRQQRGRRRRRQRRARASRGAAGRRRPRRPRGGRQCGVGAGAAAAALYGAGRRLRAGAADAVCDAGGDPGALLCVFGGGGGEGGGVACVWGGGGVGGRVCTCARTPGG